MLVNKNRQPLLINAGAGLALYRRNTQQPVGIHLPKWGSANTQWSQLGRRGIAGAKWGN